MAKASGSPLEKEPAETQTRSEKGLREGNRQEWEWRHKYCEPRGRGTLKSYITTGVSLVLSVIGQPQGEERKQSQWEKLSAKLRGMGLMLKVTECHD